MPMPMATTQRWSAKCTPSIISATRSRPDRSAASISASALSVAATNRRLTADFDVERDVSSTWGHRLEPGGVAAGGQLRHHALERHLAQEVRRGEQLVRRDRHLRRSVRRTNPGTTDRDPAAAEHDRAGLGAVAHGAPLRVVLELRSGQRRDALVDQGIHDLKPCAHGQRQQPLTQ